MHWFIYLWFIVAVIIVIGSVFWAGYDKKMPSWEKEQIVVNVILIALFWPPLLFLAAAFAIISAPFYGIFYLGKLFSPK